MHVERDGPVFFGRSRDDARAKSHSESRFGFLDRVGTPYFAQIRDLLNAWTAALPTDEQADVVAGLRSHDDRRWGATFFELWLSTLFRSLGYEVEHHPALTGTDARPDFLLSRAGQAVCYVEARVTSPSDQETSAERRRARLYDGINERLAVPDFFLDLDIDGEGPSDVALTPLVNDLQVWLDGLRWQEVHAGLLEQGPESLPGWTWRSQGWALSARPIPKKPEARGDPDDRPIGIYGGMGGWIDDAGPIRRAIRKKVRKYGDPPAPLILAIQPTGMIVDDHDVIGALYGSEVVRFNRETPDDFHLARLPNGAWSGPHGFQNTRVAGLLTIRKLYSHSPGSALAHRSSTSMDSEAPGRFAARCQTDASARNLQNLEPTKPWACPTLGRRATPA
jgi:hypothetical protein